MRSFLSWKFQQCFQSLCKIHFIHNKHFWLRIKSLAVSHTPQSLHAVCPAWNFLWLRNIDNSIYWPFSHIFSSHLSLSSRISSFSCYTPAARSHQLISVSSSIHMAGKWATWKGSTSIFWDCSLLCRAAVFTDKLMPAQRKQQYEVVKAKFSPFSKSPEISYIKVIGHHYLNVSE